MNKGHEVEMIWYDKDIVDFLIRPTRPSLLSAFSA